MISEVLDNCHRRHPIPEQVKMRASMRIATLPLLLLSSVAVAQVTSPQKFFGHEIGADYQLPNYEAFANYWRKLDLESDRMQLVDIGATEEGRQQIMAIVSSPANLRRKEHYRQIAEKLARGRITEAEARKLAGEGKAVVWIDGGLHASEVLGAQQLMETLYRFVSENDAETKRILNDCIILFVHANPDGMDLCSDWYMRNSDPLKRSLSNLPRLYQKYVGHDNNRDFYGATQKETINMNRVMYREWYPQIMYNHHQTGPQGTVLFVPPFRPPFNHHVDPLVMAGVDMVGIAMQSRLIEEGKGGAATRTGASYSAWWNGGLRTTAYFHNIIGILTETIGSPTPSRIPFVADRQVMSGDLLLPIEPQEWKFRQSVEYSVTANKAILDLASRRRESFLFGTYRMAKNSVDKGGKDSWTNYPARVAAAMKESGRDGNKAQEFLRKPELRDARAYIIPTNQPDFPTAVKFVNTLIRTGVEVQRVEERFIYRGARTGPALAPGAIAKDTPGDAMYGPGTLIIRCDQAFRPHVVDMFEPQDHPNDVPVPGAAPIPPYDSAGWTLAFQMGIKFDRALDEVPQFPAVKGELPMPDPFNTNVTAAKWVMLSPYQNNSFPVARKLMEAGVTVQRAQGRAGLDEHGTWVVPYGTGVKEKVEKICNEYGVDYNEGNGPQPESDTVEMLRVGLWDRFGGSMESGWMRWLLEQFGIPYKAVYAPELDAGNLRSKYDVLIMPGGAIPGLRAARPEGGDPPMSEAAYDPEALVQGGQGGGEMPSTIPAEFQPMWGRVTADKTIPQLKTFLEEGGKIVAIGSSTNIAYHLGLPIESGLVDAEGKALPRSKYYIPASVLRARVDTSLRAAWGMQEHADFMFDNSPVFRIKEGVSVVPLAWFDTDTPLRSGWALGQEVLKDKVLCAEAAVGKGKVYLYGPEITFRAQPHGTFKLLFNVLFG